MSSTVVDVSELQSFDSESVKALADFLEKRLDGTVTVAKKEVTLDFEEGKEASRSCLRLLLRKFLHREDLKLDFRVISGGENVFVMKERKEYYSE
jgi:NMD protein affecting ribosome stability and mRNA decay